MTRAEFPALDEATILRLAGSIGLPVPEQCLPILLANMQLLARHKAALDTPSGTQTE